MGVQKVFKIEHEVDKIDEIMQDYANKKKTFLQESKEKREVIQLVISHILSEILFLSVMYLLDL